MPEIKEEIEDFGIKLDNIRDEVSKGLIGQRDVLDSVLKCLVCRGHVLLEGVPGLAKTLLVRLLSAVIQGSSFKRIQFTPDLLPSDIIGTTIYEKEKGSFKVRKGPIFANFVLADEINRTTPKVQSAMLQAMQEREVTIGKETHSLPKPFAVMATQNPLEQAGTYPLSVAQTDRFLFKVFVDYPEPREEEKIIDQNMEVKEVESFGVENTLNLDELVKIQELVKKVKITEEIKDYILNIVESTRYPDEYGLEYDKFIDYGASSRASIFLALGGKANALMNERDYVTPEDIRKVTYPVLRHRIILNYEGKSRNLNTDDIIKEIIDTVTVV
ncbi:MAG: AAA family ATPase [Candidatus Aenigmatarchaeota archaeon]